ncbi:hypothetical protein J7J08_04390 [Stenotrophomonas sp. ISL-67]|uniref:hypothetical protein n=1 Tax=Stenotrophomonas sp. ISL-67 TaxID=2819171 RepID=UPI001BE7CB35|nr:hypothetical protein [Stenotrophomonas sp. ISL-67]MBT2766866.1 hypothetical protein [Stenotrophomonas sp. ISL-67]
MDTWQFYLHAGPSRTCWLGNKYEDKKRGDRGRTGTGGREGIANGRVALQHVIEKTTAVLPLSTVFRHFPTVSAESSAQPRHVTMVARESVLVNASSSFEAGFLRGSECRGWTCA